MQNQQPLLILTYRYPTGAGRQALARRLGLEVPTHSQDWEYEFADGERFDELLTPYHHPALSDDERVSLGAMLLQCAEDLSEGLSHNEIATASYWAPLTKLLFQDLNLHATEIIYWALLDEEELGQAEDWFRITKPLRVMALKVMGHPQTTEHPG